jgi:Uma2 family endonuclease
MTLEEFARVQGKPGHLYELEKGVILVVDVPGVPHGLVVQAIRNPLIAYQLAHQKSVFYIASGHEAVLRMPDMQSERHPDLLIYLTPPPSDDAHPWEYWIPDIVLEVISPGSEDRDYRVKREEYLKAGIRLYWIADPASRTITVLTRHGDAWREQRLEISATLTTSLLPGFELNLLAVFPPRT